MSAANLVKKAVFVLVAMSAMSTVAVAAEDNSELHYRGPTLVSRITGCVWPNILGEIEDQPDFNFAPIQCQGGEEARQREKVRFKRASANCGRAENPHACLVRAAKL